MAIPKWKVVNPSTDTLLDWKGQKIPNDKSKYWMNNSSRVQSQEKKNKVQTIFLMAASKKINSTKFRLLFLNLPTTSAENNKKFLKRSKSSNPRVSFQIMNFKNTWFLKIKNTLRHRKKERTMKRNRKRKVKKINWLCNTRLISFRREKEEEKSKNPTQNIESRNKMACSRQREEYVLS